MLAMEYTSKRNTKYEDKEEGKDGSESEDGDIDD
jgi:hypothetical protein